MALESAWHVVVRFFKLFVFVGTDGFTGTILVLKYRYQFVQYFGLEEPSIMRV